MNPSCIITIQQRFWYARARWNTRKRIARRIMKAGLVYHTSAESTMSEFVGTLFHPHVVRWFPVWLERNFRIVTEEEARIVLSSFMFSIFMLPVVNMIESTAYSVAVATTVLMRSDLPKHRAVFSRAVEKYLAEFLVWRDSNEEAVLDSLMLEMLSLAHDHVMKRRSFEASEEMRYSMQKCAITLARPCSHIRSRVFGSREMKVMRALPQSPFWGTCGLSVFRLMHELLMDERFELSLDKCLDNLVQKYTPIPTSPLVVTYFLSDVRSALLWVVQEPQTLRRMVQALDLENEPWPEDIRGISVRLMPLICAAIPTYDMRMEVQALWERTNQNSHAAMLSTMLFGTRALRYEHARLELQQCRNHVRRHTTGFYPNAISSAIEKATQTRFTEEWLQRILHTCSSLEVDRIAQGDPYALLGLHHHSIVDFALEGNFVSSVPEILIFDIERLEAVRSTVSATESVCWKDPMRLKELVSCNDDDRSGAPAAIIEACRTLRHVIFVSRFQHGIKFAQVARSIAQKLMEANALLGITHWG